MEGLKGFLSDAKQDWLFPLVILAYSLLGLLLMLGIGFAALQYVGK